MRQFLDVKEAHPEGIVFFRMGDFYEIGALLSVEIASAQMYYRLLNCGFRLPATSGTDNFSDVWRDTPP